MSGRPALARQLLALCAAQDVTAETPVRVVHEIDGHLYIDPAEQRPVVDGE